MGKIKIGFVGVGYMGQKAHLANYTMLDDCEVVAIAEPRKELAQKVAARYEIKKMFDNHLDLINNCEVDAIVAAQPYKHHGTLVPDILNAGIPLLTEKPIALSVEVGEKLASLADRKKVLYMVGYHKRSDPAMEYAKEKIEKWKCTGEYGKLRYVRITMPPGDWIGGAGSALSSDEAYPETILETEVPGFDGQDAKKYDEFVNYYIHQVNALRFLLGEPYKLNYADPSGVLLVAESQSGVCGVIEMAPYHNTVDWQEALLVCFEKGFIKVELPAPLASQQSGRVTIMQDNGEGVPLTIHPSLPKLSAMRKQAMNFVKAVRGGGVVPCDAKEAVEDLKIARDYIKIINQYK